MNLPLGQDKPPGWGIRGVFFPQCLSPEWHWGERTSPPRPAGSMILFANLGGWMLAKAPSSLSHGRGRRAPEVGHERPISPFPVPTKLMRHISAIGFAGFYPAVRRIMFPSGSSTIAA